MQMKLIGSGFCKNLYVGNSVWYLTLILTAMASPTRHWSGRALRCQSSPARWRGRRVDRMSEAVKVLPDEFFNCLAGQVSDDLVLNVGRS